METAARKYCVASSSGGGKCCVCHCLRWSVRNVGGGAKALLARNRCQFGRPQTVPRLWRFAGEQWHTAVVKQSCCTPAPNCGLTHCGGVLY